MASWIWLLVTGSSVVTFATLHYVIKDAKRQAATASIAAQPPHPDAVRRLSLADLPTIHVDGVNCSALFSGDETELRKASKLQAATKTTLPTSSPIIRHISDCEHFVTERRYARWPVNDEEEEFPIAFSILLFKDVEQFERLLRAIYRPQNFYCIHVDSKSTDEIYTTVHTIAKCFQNVFVLQPSFDVRWGEFSVLEPELACMKTLLRCSKKWKYFINLTGQEFPLKTNWQIVRILKAFNRSNNLEGTIKRRNMDRFEKNLPAPHNITVVKGSVHIVAVRRFVKYAVRSRKALDFLDWVKHTQVPDETYFASLNHNPHLRVPGSYLGNPETDDVTYRFFPRFKNWGNWPCHGKQVRTICVFGVGDLPLLSSRPELFANKFYTDYEPLALDCMEELHYRRLSDEIRAGDSAQFNTSEYTAQDFVRNHI